MRNIRELSIGSLVSFFQPDATEYICEVTEIRKRVVWLRILDILRNDINAEPETPLKIGETVKLPNGRINGITIYENFLRMLDFVESDEKSWSVMYYYGDMRLYYKYYKAGRFARFKFKPDYTQKTWVRIDCHYVHQLQNIMRFLTGGELEFIYNKEKKDGCNL